MELKKNSLRIGSKNKIKFQVLLTNFIIGSSERMDEEKLPT